MRYVSHWPSLTPLLFLAVYLPRRCSSTFAVPWRYGVRDLRCTKRAGHDGVHTHPYFRRRGTPLGGGFRKLSAYTRKKVLGMGSGTFTASLRTEAAYSFSSLRGRASAVLRRRYKPSPLVLRVNSYTGHGSSTDVTAVRGVSGAPREIAA